jgi:hypothetical protein
MIQALHSHGQRPSIDSALLLGLGGKQWTKPIPPETNRFVSLMLQISNNVVVDQTKAVKVRTYRFDEESVRCSALTALRRCRNLSAIMRRNKAILITRDI